jgi:hypothetical protein
LTKELNDKFAQQLSLEKEKCAQEFKAKKQMYKDEYVRDAKKIYEKDYEQKTIDELARLKNHYQKQFDDQKKEIEDKFEEKLRVAENKMRDAQNKAANNEQKINDL